MFDLILIINLESCRKKIPLRVYDICYKVIHREFTIFSFK